MSTYQPVKLLPFPASTESPTVSNAKKLLCGDPKSQSLLRQMDRLAPTEATVLIVGETGTGKEVAARYIHERSRRRGPFVAVNCGAISETLVEAELFGHESGAFTGAQQARPGWFEVAQGGTLFLDEIGDMPLYLQVRLLRVLQERQVVRLGSSKATPIDVRLIAATNVDLEKAVQSGRFRRDLYYRLSVAPMKLLPLRERRGDILPLARGILERHAVQLGLPNASLCASAEEALLIHNWPGNVRELENVIHLALIMSSEGRIDVSDLRLTCEIDIAANRTQADADPEAVQELTLLDEGLRRMLNSNRDGVYHEIERLLLTRTFEHCAGNQVRTAKRLGVSRNVVRAQLKRFGLLSG